MAIVKVDPHATRFLNVDLDLYSKSDLGPLVALLGRKVAVLYSGVDKGRYRAHLEVAKLPQSADATMRAFCSLIEALPAAGREIWNNATIRDFNIGVEAGFRPHATEFVLSAATVQSAASLGARIVFTVYAHAMPETRAGSRK